MDLAFASRELRLEGRQARLSGRQLLRFRGGSGLRLLGIRDPCVDGAFEFQEILLIDLELRPTSREILEVLADCGLAGFQSLRLDLDPSGLCDQTFSLRGETALFCRDALLALVQLRLDRSDRSLALADPVRLLRQLRLSGLYLSRPRVEIRAESLELPCEIIDRLPVVRDLGFAALQVFLLRIDCRLVGSEAAPLLVDLVLHCVQFAGPRLDTHPPFLEFLRVCLELGFPE